MKIYILIYTHERGDNVWPYASEEARLKGLADICREFWMEAVERSRYRSQPMLPLVPPAGDIAIVPLYFDAMADLESYRFDEQEVPVDIQLISDIGGKDSQRATLKVEDLGDRIMVTDARTGAGLVGLRLEATGSWELTTWNKHGEATSVSKLGTDPLEVLDEQPFRARFTRDETAHVVVYGDPITGFGFIGPFDDLGSAEHYLAETRQLDDAVDFYPQWLAELDPPIYVRHGIEDNYRCPRHFHQIEERPLRDEYEVADAHRDPEARCGLCQEEKKGVDQKPE